MIGFIFFLVNNIKNYKIMEEITINKYNYLARILLPPLKNK